MSTLTPRPPYSDEELRKLYPKHLQLQQVQILLRHGERTPVSARFQNAGLPSYWAYCNAAKRFRVAVATSKDLNSWGELGYERRLETFGHSDEPVLAAGPKGELDGICLPGELTDQGRQTTLALGQRLRHLYIEQLGFLPAKLSRPDMLYLRTTPIPRALESLQQAFTGLYPLSSRTSDCPYPIIVSRAPQDETLFPNEGACRRFRELSRAFADRAATRWNDSSEMNYVNKKIGKWMPESSPRVKVDSHPRLSGVMDTINSTRAHGKEVQLPGEFYDHQVAENIDKVAVEEWFAGYRESNEYRKLGVGSLLGDITQRMVAYVESSVRSASVPTDEHRQLQQPTFALSGCHDTTLAAALTSLGAFDGEHWPPFTSSIAFELFRASSAAGDAAAGMSTATVVSNPTRISKPTSTWWTALFGGFARGTTPHTPRITTANLTEEQASSLNNYFVRIRFNDRVKSIPACKPAGRHLEGDESFCTLAAFKEVVDTFTPAQWREECGQNLGKGVLDADMTS